MATKEKEIQYPRKITMKTILGEKLDFEKLMKVDGKRLQLADIYGVATKAKPGESDLGPYVRFLGQFRATNLETGEVFESAVCILPRFIEEQLMGAMGLDGAQNVEFALRVSAKYDKDAATKYVYEAKNLLPTRESDALQSLTERVGDAVKALPKPNK